MSPNDLRAFLPVFLSGFIDDPEAGASNLTRVRTLAATWSDDTCRGVLAAMSSLEPGDHVLPAHPAGRELSRVWCRDVVIEPELHGVEHLATAVEAGPTVVLGNHLSYFDTSATDAILAWAGHTDLADRLVVMAGPKVYTDTFRRVAVLGLHTLPVPQSTSLAHTQKIPVRELARQARASLDAAAGAAASGQVLFFYPEGSRTRTGRMNSFLRGVHRYLAVGGDRPTRVVPCAITGTDRIMGLDSNKLHPGKVTVSFGPPVEVCPAMPPKVALSEAFHGVAALLPEDLRPANGTAPLA